jgi:L-proline amide hydrolase
MVNVEEGHVPFLGHRTWYRSVGEASDPARLPVLTVHGGPGATHAALEPLEALAEDGRRVVFYDQLGCGRSDRPREPVTWSIPLFLGELAAVRRALGLGRLHVLGHSWGGVLAMEHLLAGGDGVRSLVLASSPMNAWQWTQEARRLRARLPAPVRRTLELHEAGGTVGDDAYLGAMLEYQRRHVCRLEPWPACVGESMLRLRDDPRVHDAMYGPSEFDVTGSLRGWDVIERLPELRLPVLVTSGRHDAATPAIARTAYRRIAGARWALFGRSAHLAHVEETGAYVGLVRRFLDEVEAG